MHGTTWTKLHKMGSSQKSVVVGRNEPSNSLVLPSNKPLPRARACARATTVR
jgi:hypothetical protein